MISYRTAVLPYDAKAYPFRELIYQHFGCPLECLHETLQRPVERLQVGRDQNTDLHKKFYTIAPEFLTVYRGFVREVALSGEDWSQYLYQKIPTFRVHLPGNVATGGFHRDKDYNHNPKELNFLVPVTFMEDSNSVWIESAIGRDDCQPVTVRVGQFLRFHGAELKHGSVENATGQTRVSFDFRVLHKRDYDADSEKSTINLRVPLKIGGYWEEVQK